MPQAGYSVPLIGSYQVISIPVSFETNEVGTISLPCFPYRCRPVAFESVVSKAVEASNDATIKLYNDSTELASITVAASSTVGDEDEDTSVTESEFELDDQLKIVTAKSTAGGRAIVFITVEVLPSHA